MTQKFKDLLHAIVITLFALLCLTCFVGGTIYLIATCSGSVASIFGSILWSLMWAGGSALFGWASVSIWKEWFYWYKNKNKEE